MRKPLEACVALLLLCGLAVAACGATGVPYAATVAGHRISQSGLDDELRSIGNNAAFSNALEQSGGIKVRGKGVGTFDSGFVARILSRQIIYQLFDDELARRKLVIGSRDLDSARQSVVAQFAIPPAAGQSPDPSTAQSVFNAFPKAYQAVLVRRGAEVTVLRSALDRAYYDGNRAQLIQVCASHVLLAVKDAQGNVDFTASKTKADAVEAELAAGKDFATVAKSESNDPGSAAQGGDLGCSSPDQYVAEFAQAVRTQPIGTVGPPVKTQFGYHVIKVTSRKPLTFTDFEAQASQSQDPNADRLTVYLRQITTTVKITVDPRYGSFDASQLQVVPPPAPSPSPTGVPGGTAGTPSVTTVPGGQSTSPGSEPTSVPTSPPTT